MIDPTQLDFQSAPQGSFAGAIATPFVVCPDCHTPMTPQVGITPNHDGFTGIITNCRCNPPRIWRIGFQVHVESAPAPRVQAVSQLPKGLVTARS